MTVFVFIHCAFGSYKWCIKMVRCWSFALYVSDCSAFQTTQDLDVVSVLFPWLDRISAEFHWPASLKHPAGTRTKHCQTIPSLNVIGYCSLETLLLLEWFGNVDLKGTGSEWRAHNKTVEYQNIALWNSVSFTVHQLTPSRTKGANPFPVGRSVDCFLDVKMIQTIHSNLRNFLLRIPGVDHSGPQ